MSRILPSPHCTQPVTRSCRLSLLPQIDAARVLAACILLTVLASPVAAQTGTGAISGIVMDEETGETLIGVNVVIAGSTRGTSTDLDGRYRIDGLTSGTYDVIFSYVGFDTRTVTGVDVHVAATTTILVTLNPTALGLGEVTVDARALRNTEASLLRLQARAPSISDGISAEQMRRAPDSHAGEALRRVTGVSIVGGKFALVRGIPERYNGTMLNGASVASTEPDRRAFSYDMLPSNLLENAVIVKSSTPNLPGDFSGGLLQLNTISYPERFSLSVSYATSYSPGVTFEPFVSSAAGRWDLLGFDDGTRSLSNDFPSENLSRLPADTVLAMQPQLVDMLGNNWTQSARVAPVNSSLSVSAANTFSMAGRDVGLVAALTYRNSYRSSGIIRREVETEDFHRFDFSGSQYVHSVNWGGMLNLHLRLSGHHVLSFRNLYTRSADDDVTNLEGNHYEAGFDQLIVGMRYLGRDVYSGQLSGEHFFPWSGNGRGLQFQWDAFLNHTRREEPDYRRLTYNRPIGSSEDRFAGIFYDVRLGTGGRFFSNLDEVGHGGAAHVTLPVAHARLTAGAGLENKMRDFTTRLIGAATPRRGFDRTLLRLPLNQIFDRENFRDDGFRIVESAIGSGSYGAEQDVRAIYLMTDMPLLPVSRRLRIVGGLRNEWTRQTMDSISFAGDSVEVDRSYADLLPSVNLTYALSDRSNVRLAYSRSVNRPELRELAPYAYYDFEVQTTIYGNPDLRRATIHNFDLRVETYPGNAQMLSASVFYKQIDAAIERVVVPGVALNAERTFANADRAVNYGLELEARYGLGFLHRLLEESSVHGNYTRVHSDVTVEGSGLVLSRKGRPLQGQSPYVVNLGVTFQEPRLGTQVSVLYNRFGTRIIEVATAFEADVVEKPRGVLDLVITHPINGRYDVRLTARDVFAREQRFTQDGVLLRSNSLFPTYSVGLSARI